MATDIIARGMITEYIAGTNINFTENRDGTVEISASGSISSEDSVARDAIGNHKSDTSNPHNVTPAQIGLGNVDNTSDLDKPISTAVQKAIDNKADKTVATTSADGLMSAEDKGKLDSADDTYALKSKYGDTTIDVGRKADTTVGIHSTAEGTNTTASGICSHAEGANTKASEYCAHAEGSVTKASGSHSHAEGRYTQASGEGSHAEGNETIARGSGSHAEGSNYSSTGELSDRRVNISDGGISTLYTIKGSYAYGINSHAEGTQSFAYGDSSHAEGQGTTASGNYSHAEGHYTVSSGTFSHAGGYYTKALHDNEVSYGAYNESNDDTLFSIGDGTGDDARHNAFEITTTGGKLHDKSIATTEMLSEYLPLTGGMTTGTTGLAGNFRVYVGDFTRVQFLLNGSWATVITGDNTNNGIIVGNLGLNKAALNVDDPSHAYVNSYPIYSAGYKPFATGSFGKSAGKVATVDCGFTPTYALIFSCGNNPVIYSSKSGEITLSDTGFTVNASIAANTYNYIAFR